MEEELQTIVERMVEAGESEENIALVIKNFKKPEKGFFESIGDWLTKPIVPSEETNRKLDQAGTYLSGFGRAAYNVPGDILKTAAIFGDYLTDPVDEKYRKKPDTPVEEMGVYKAGQAWEDYWNKKFTINPEYQDDFAYKLSSGAGTLATMIATGPGGLGREAAKRTVLQRIKDIPRAVVNTIKSPTGVIAGSYATDEFKAAKDAGLTDDEAFNVFFKNYLVNQTDAIPIEAAFSRLNKLFNGTISSKIYAIGEGGLIEGLQEGVQQYLSNKIAEDSYDPNRDELFGVMESVSVGGILGMMLPSIGVVMQNNPKAAKKIEEKVAQLEQKAIALDQAEKSAQEISTGNPEIDAEIDQAATLTPQEEAAFKVTQENKLREDAIQESETEGVDVRKQTPDGEKVGEGNIQEEIAKEEAIDSPQKMRQIDPLFTASPIQKQIEDVTGITPQEPITLAPKEAIKAQFQAVTKGMKKGVAIGQDKVNELVVKAKEALKEFPLSNKQTEAILTKIKNTNINVPGTSKRSVSALNQFIDKVSKDAQYVEQIDQATQLQKKIKPQISKATPKEKFALRQLVALDPEEVDVAKYNEILTSVTDSFKPIQKRVPLDLAKVNEFVDKATAKVYKKEFGKDPEVGPAERIFEVQQKRAQDLENERLQQLADESGIDADALEAYLENPEEVDQQIGEDKKKRLRDTFVNVAKTIKPQLNISEESLTEPQKKRLAEIKKIDPEKLNEKELREYIRTVDRIGVNKDFGNSERMVAIGKAAEGMQKIKSKLKGGKIINLNAIESGATASLPQAIESVFGLPEDAAIFQLYSGITGISNSKAKAEQEAQAFVQMMNDLEKDFRGKYGSERSGFTPDSQIRQGVYSELIRQDEDVEPDEALKKNKEAIEASITVYGKSGNKQDALTLEKLYAPFKDAKTMEEVQSKMAKIDPAGKKVTEKIIDWFKKYKPLIDDYNESVFNSPSQNILNYAGGRKWITEISEEVKDYDDLDSPTRPSSKVKKISSAKKFLNYIPAGKVLDLNLHKKTADQVEETVFRANADPYRLQVREFAARKPEIVEMMGDPKKGEKIYRRIFDKKDGLVKSFEDALLGKSSKTELERSVGNVMSLVQKIGYSASLSGLTQAPKQYSVLLSTAVNLGRNMPYLASSIAETANPKFKEFFEGETVNIRGVSQSLLNLGDMWRASDALAEENKVKKLFTKGAPKYVQRQFDSWWGGLKPLTKSDASAAKISFLAYYKDKLNDLGEKYQGLDREIALRDSESRQEARAYAKQMVDKTQVVSNPAELARAVKTKTIAGQTLKALFLPFGSFRLNKVQRLYSDYRTLATGTLAQKKAAAKDISAAFAESVAFEAINWGLRLTVYAGLRELYRNLFDLDEPEEDNQKKNLVNAVTNVAIDNLPTLLVEPAKNAFVDGMKEAAYNYATTNIPEYQEMTKKEFEEETGISAKPFQPKGLTNYLGTYGIAGENLMEASSMMAEAMDENSELTKEQKRLMLFTAGLMFGNLGGLVPADLKNPAIKEVSSQKK